MSSDSGEQSFFEKPENVKKILKVFYVSCALLILLDLVDLIGKWTGNDALHFKKGHIHYSAEGWFGFYGIYGLVGCVALVLAAKVLRKIVMREEDYYDR